MASGRGRTTHCVCASFRADVCVKFASNQPAPRGNMAVHCGGPGSLSDFMYTIGRKEYIGSDNVENYNLISFDQASTLVLVFNLIALSTCRTAVLPWCSLEVALLISCCLSIAAWNGPVLADIHRRRVQNAQRSLQLYDGRVWQRCPP